MSAPRIVAIEGTDAVGKTTHAHHLALTLRREGMSAVPWEHRPADPELGPYARALHYALERARFVERLPDVDVVVADRWLWSTEVAAQALGAGDAATLRNLARVERLKLPSAHVILLHAPQEEIERRLRARGESIDGVAAQQAEYWRLAEHQGWPAVATTLPREQVTARLVGIVRGWL